MKRVLAAAATVVLLTIALPAHAAAPVVQIARPLANEQFVDTSTFQFEATVGMPNNGTLRGNVTVSWFSPEGHPVPATTTHPSGNNRSISITVPDRTFPWNGTYRVDVSAVGRDGVLDQSDETGRGSAQFVIDVPPVPPTGVTTAVDAERRVAVAWSANGEPDIVGYEVQRSVDAGTTWEQVTVTDASTTGIVDEATAHAGGLYTYQVFAFRASADVSKLNASGPSSPSTAQVPDPPVTTTTTVPPDDDEEEEEGENEGGERSRTGSRGLPGGSSTGSTGSSGARGSGGGSSSTLAEKGKVDLSGFSSLLEQARRSGQTPAAGRTAGTGEEDGEYDEKLPFGGRKGARSGSDDGDDVAILDEGISDDGSGRVRSLALLAGGLLATVLVMHLLWVRSEVHRAGVLEAVPPERPRRTRKLRPTGEDA